MYYDQLTVLGKYIKFDKGYTWCCESAALNMPANLEN